MKLKVTAAEQCQWIMNKQSIDIFTENVRQCQWIMDKQSFEIFTKNVVSCTR